MFYYAFMEEDFYLVVLLLFYHSMKFEGFLLVYPFFYYLH